MWIWWHAKTVYFHSEQSLTFTGILYIFQGILPWVAINFETLQNAFRVSKYCCNTNKSHCEASDNQNDDFADVYLNWASSRPPRDDPQMEKPMAITPFQKPSSLAVMWWSNRKRGNMVTAPCSPVGERGGRGGKRRLKRMMGERRRRKRNNRGRNRKIYIKKTCTSVTKHCCFYMYSKYVRCLLNTRASSNHSQIRWGCCTKLFSLQDWTTWFSWDNNCRIEYSAPTHRVPRPIPGKCQ